MSDETKLEPFDSRQAEAEHEDAMRPAPDEGEVLCFACHEFGEAVVLGKPIDEMTLDECEAVVGKPEDFDGVGYYNSNEGSKFNFMPIFSNDPTHVNLDQPQAARRAVNDHRYTEAHGDGTDRHR